MLARIRTIQAQKSEEGASAVEYALLVAAIAALIVIVVFAFGGLIQNIFQDTCDSIATEAAPARTAASQSVRLRSVAGGTGRQCGASSHRRIEEQLMSSVTQSRGGEDGASAVEYALMIAGIAAVIVVVVFAFGGMVRALNHDNCTTIADTASPGYDCRQ